MTACYSSDRRRQDGDNAGVNGHVSNGQLISGRPRAEKNSSLVVVHPTLYPAVCYVELLPLPPRGDIMQCGEGF